MHTSSQPVANETCDRVARVMAADTSRVKLEVLGQRTVAAYDVVQNLMDVMRHW